MWQGGSLRDNPDWQALQRRIQAIELRMGTTATTVVNASSPKRYRIAVRRVSLALLGTVSVSIVWTTPFSSASYTMDISCTALVGMPTVTVTNQTETGCTLTFTPGLLATDAILVVFAVAPTV